ncbi:MAG TPA: aldehyde dehydrogenase family protein, partial [Gaiellaceae bacterium]|nr:aldehyde dehydrogenase family protein [Gaiellaceae bacterium]
MTEIERRTEGSLVPAEWTYAPAPESRDVVRIEERYGLFVGGEWLEPRSGEYFATIAPRDEEPLADVAQAGEEDVALAVASARHAFTPWSKLPGAERAKYMFRIARILAERSREFAVLESLN